MAKPSKSQQDAAARSVRAFESQVSRQRVDHFAVNGGRTIRCVLTITLPGGHEMRVPSDIEISGAPLKLRTAHNVTKTGWTFGQKRITTADANALQLYAAKKNSWLSRYGNHGKPDLAAQQRIDDNRERIVSDIYFAAQILDTLSKHERTWIRDKYHPHGFIQDVKDVASGPLGFVVNPALALAGHTLKDKEFEGARNLAKAAVPGASAASVAAAKAASTISSMRSAGEALKAAASTLGPVAPAALAASKTLHATAAIVAAREHSRRGDKGKARKLVQYAASVAKDPATMHVAQENANRVYAVLMRPA